MVFNERDFAPSKATSTVVHVPASFPSDVPSSDPAEPLDDELQAKSDSSDSDFDPLDDTEGAVELSCIGYSADKSGPESNKEESSHNSEEGNPSRTVLVSGLMDTLASLETKIVHSTQPTTA